MTKHNRSLRSAFRRLRFGLEFMEGLEKLNFQDSFSSDPGSRKQSTRIVFG